MLSLCKLNYAARRSLEEIEHQDQRIAVTDILKPVRRPAIEEHRIALIQQDHLFLDLVFDTAFQDVFAFEGIRADHLAAVGFLFQLQQHDIGCLRSDASGEDTFISKAPDGFLREMLFFPFADNEDIVFAIAVLHVLEKAAQVLFQGVDDIEQNGK